MKKLTGKIIFILPNMVVILSLIFITLWILDLFNPGTNVLGNKISSALLIIFFVLSLINAIATIALERKREE